MHFDNIQTIKEAVALGSGVSILPARTMQAEIEQGRLVAVPLEAPGLIRPVGIRASPPQETQPRRPGVSGSAHRRPGAKAGTASGLDALGLLQQLGGFFP